MTLTLDTTPTTLTTTASLSPLDRATQLLPTISLDELNALAALQTRRDRKYVLAPGMASELVAWLASLDSQEEARVLEIDGNRSSLYDSLYLDTPDMSCYRMAVQKNRRRFKVRRRTYVDSGQSFLRGEDEVRERTNRQESRRVGHARDGATRL